MSFGFWLRHFRLQRKIGLREMAKKIKMDSGNYSRLENGKMPPPKHEKGVTRIIKPLGLYLNGRETMFREAIEFHQKRIERNFWSNK